MKYALNKIFFSIVLFGFLPSSVFASAQITEIMYDLPGSDTGREWIEIQNTGTSSIDLSAWKLFEASTNHKITAVGSAMLPAQGFAVISDVPDKFRADNPNFSGLLFDSTFSLGNEGETLILRDESGADIDTVTYVPSIGAGGDGNTLQKSASGNWLAGLPSPGSVFISASNNQSNQTASSTDNLTNSSTTTSILSGEIVSAHIGQEVANVSPDEIVLEVTSGRSRLGFVGSPLPFEARVKASKSVSSAAFTENLWSMGDGSVVAGKYINHTYSYPGDYIVVLNSQFGDARAVSKTLVKIVEPKINMADATPNYITIFNSDFFEINIGGYSLVNERSRFDIPQDTIVPPRISLKIPYANTKLSLGNSVRLLNPSGKEVSNIKIRSDLPLSGAIISLPSGVTADLLRQRLVDFLKVNYQN